MNPLDDHYQNSPFLPENLSPYHTFPTPSTFNDAATLARMDLVRDRVNAEHAHYCQTCYNRGFEHEGPAFPCPEDHRRPLLAIPPRFALERPHPFRYPDLHTPGLTRLRRFQDPFAPRVGPLSPTAVDNDVRAPGRDPRRRSPPGIPRPGTLYDPSSSAAEPHRRTFLPNPVHAGVPVSHLKPVLVITSQPVSNSTSKKKGFKWLVLLYSRPIK